jgi:hypothetical protein
VTPPTFHIIVELERDRPWVFTDAVVDSELVRLEDWVRRRPDLRSLLLRALELANPEPA